MSSNSFFVINTIEENGISINNYDSSIINNDSIIIYSPEFIIDTTTSYDCEFIKFPYFIRKKIMDNCKEHLYTSILDKIFTLYTDFINNIFIKNSHDQLIISTCMNYYDICLIAPKGKYNLKEIKDKIISSFNTSLVNLNDSKLCNYIKLRDRCLNDDRQYICQNHFNKYDYTKLIRKTDTISYDNISKKYDLTFISILILKELINESKLYFVYESGEYRYPNANFVYILRKNIKEYDNLFKQFINQSVDNNKYNDVIWYFRFLSQKLLSCIENDENKNLNFVGFIPVIIDGENKYQTIDSWMKNHISSKYIFPILKMPNDSSFNMVNYLPGFINQLSRYISIDNSENENKVLVKLVLNSIFYPLHEELSKETFEDIINMCSDFDKLGIITDFYNCDNMEFIQRLVYLYNKGWGFSLSKYPNREAAEKVKKFKEQFKQFNRNLYQNIYTFSFLMDNIKSDIGMCKFFDLNLSQYIELLSKQKSFAALDLSLCSTSTILHFGFMCRYLYNRNLKEIDNEKWFNTCIEIINSLKEKGCPNDDEFNTRCDNLKDYLKEFIDITIESEENVYVPKGQSLLENLLIDNNIISEWEKNFEVYDNNRFMKFLKDVYVKYMNSDEIEKIKINYCMRVLFRDLPDNLS